MNPHKLKNQALKKKKGKDICHLMKKPCQKF